MSVDVLGVYIMGSMIFVSSFTAGVTYMFTSFYYEEKIRVLCERYGISEADIE